MSSQSLLKDNLPGLVKWALGLAVAGIILWGDNRWVKGETLRAHEEAANARLKPLEEIRPEVRDLQRWQAEQKYESQQTSSKMEALNRELADIKTQLGVTIALLNQQSKSTDRIMVLLDDQRREKKP